MDKNRVQEIIIFFKNQLIESGLYPVTVILFGSQKESNSSEESDIDLAVVSEMFIGLDIFQRSELISQAEILTIKKYVVPLDIITLSPDELENKKSIIAQIVKNAEKVK